MSVSAHRQPRHHWFENGKRPGFTIIELLVVVSIIALLIGILLPAIGKARDTARVSQSQSNLRNLGTAQETYSGEWGEKQFTLSREDLGQYASPCAFQTAQGVEHPWILLGWSDSTLWGFPVNCAFVGNAPLAYPIDFQVRYGWFRLPNAKQFTPYVSNKFYDKVWWAPKDKIVIEEIEHQGCWEDPGEFCTPDNGNTYESSYCLSPAALYAPGVLSHTGWVNPKGLAGSCRAPSAAEARFPDLKTRILEHQWLQNQRPNMCNAAMTGSYEPPGCEPYYFLHGSESSPMCLFYDSHVEALGMDAVQQSNKRSVAQVGYKLWNTTTPTLSSGYFTEASYDTGAVDSPHVLTTDGIYGRDLIGK